MGWLLDLVFVVLHGFDGFWNMWVMLGLSDCGDDMIIDRLLLGRLELHFYFHASL